MRTAGCSRSWAAARSWSSGSCPHSFQRRSWRRAAGCSWGRRRSAHRMAVSSAHRRTLRCCHRSAASTACCSCSAPVRRRSCSCSGCRPPRRPAGCSRCSSAARRVGCSAASSPVSAGRGRPRSSVWRSLTAHTSRAPHTRGTAASSTPGGRGAVGGCGDVQSRPHRAAHCPRSQLPASTQVAQFQWWLQRSQ